MFSDRMMKELREKRKIYIDSVGKMEFESKEVRTFWLLIVFINEKSLLSFKPKGTVPSSV
jgi:nucleoside-triphosphatase THEP1